MTGRGLDLEFVFNGLTATLGDLTVDGCDR